MRSRRLILRRWEAADSEPFAAVNAGPVVMEYFPAPLDRADSDALIDRIERGFDEHGFGLWALESRHTGQFLGFTGLAVTGFDAHFTPAVEIGWRLARTAWGHGYATEAARAVADHAFTDLGLHQMVSFTAAANLRSQAVMRRLGMTHHPDDDFDHPGLPRGHPLERHVLYRLTQGHWTRRTSIPT